MSKLIFLIAILLGYTIMGITKSLTGKSLINRKPGHSLKLTSDLSKVEIFSRLYKLCLSTKYTVEFVEINRGLIILSEETTLFHNGFFYPIYIIEKENSIEVEVYIKHKWIFPGLLIRRYHRQIFYLITLSLQSI